MVILPNRRRADGYTKLLLHLDGADAATTTQDMSRQGHIVTFNGTAQLDTAQKVFGVSSLLLDGNSDYLSLADHSDWSFGAGNFTIDFRVRLAAAPGEGETQRFLSQYVDDDNMWEVFAYNSAVADPILAMQFRSGAATKGSVKCDYTLSINTWYHLAFVRSGANEYIFVNGTAQSLTAVTDFATNDVGDVASSLFIGSKDGSADFVNGWMDEIRISKGIARWTADFTAPTAEYR